MRHKLPRINVEYRRASLIAPSVRETGELLGAMLAVHQWPHLRFLEFYLVDDAAIANLNWQFLGCRGPTNILTFPGNDDLPGSMHLSVTTLVRECVLYYQRPLQHFLRLLAHGLGHMAGYDHSDEMRLLEEKFYEAGRYAASSMVVRTEL